MQVIQIYNGGFTRVNCRLTIIDDFLRDTFGLCSSLLPLQRNLSVEREVESGSAICRNMEMPPLILLVLFFFLIA